MLSVGYLDTSHVVSCCRKLPRFLNLPVRKVVVKYVKASCVQRDRSSWPQVGLRGHHSRMSLLSHKTLNTLPKLYMHQIPC